MAQIARPASDVSAGTWTPTPASPATLFDKLDEAVASDADFISSVLAPAAAPAVVKLQAVDDPLVNTGHKLRYRLRKNAAGGAQIDGVVALLHDPDGTPAVIASWSHANVSDAWTTFEQTLTGPQADAITNYADLGVRFTATQV